jgi:hypothetical protein
MDNQKVSIHIHITKDLHEALRLVTRSLGYSFSTYISILLRQDLSTHLQKRDVSVTGQD